MALHEVPDDTVVLLATLLPTAQQRRLGFAVLASILFLFAIVVPFSTIMLPQIVGFVVVLETVSWLNDLLTAALLYAQFWIVRSRALLVIASGYFFTATLVVPHLLTFPGAFSPTGLLGAGVQTAPWLYTFWHAGFFIFAAIYAWLRSDAASKNIAQVPSAIVWSVVILISLACGLTFLSTAGEEFLPHVFLDRTRLNAATGYPVFIAACLPAILALALLWKRQRSILDQWIAVVIIAMLVEILLLNLFPSARYSVGFYFGRFFQVVTATVVLVILLVETTRLYARVARSNATLNRERNSKLMNMEAMAASITHEVRQPLAAIAANSEAALLLFRRAPLDLEVIEPCLNDIATDSYRASKVFDDIRALFRGSDAVHEPVDMNGIVVEVLRALSGELDVHGVTTRTALTSELPLVMGNRGQLREVALNLIQNAIDAMDNTTVGNRVLEVKTQRDGSNGVIVEVQDTGSGIDTEIMDRVFDAFATTKPQGMGLGLALCRIIVERHGGQLSAWSDKKTRRGALFQFILPIKAAAAAPV